MLILRQSTEIDIRMGPFVDATDGVTPETGITIAAADQAEVLKENGAATAAMAGTFAAVTGADGWYDYTASTTDTNTVGEVVFVMQDSSVCLPVFTRAFVVEEAVYDAFFDAGAVGFASVAAISDVESSLVIIKSDLVLATSDVAAIESELIVVHSETTVIQSDTTVIEPAVVTSIPAAIAGIGAASGGALNYPIVTDNTGGAIKSVTFVGSQTSTFASTEAEDGTNHVIDDTGNAIDIVYQADIGGGRTATEVTFKGYLTGSNDTIDVQLYDFVGADWETQRTITGQSGTTNITEVIPILSKHTGTSGADLGLVNVRFVNTGQSNPQLNVDQLLVAAVNIGQSIGYADGSVWLDTSASNTNTESFVDGVADNPVSTIAAAITIAGNIGIKRITIAAGSSVTFAADMTNYEIMGDNYTIAFGGQTITGAKITGATVSGTFVGSTAILTNCIINAITGPGMTMRSCYFSEVTITNNGTAGWYMNDCRSRVAGTGRPTFDFGSAVGNTGLSLRSYSGGIELENMGQSGTDTASCEGFGNLVINANCIGGTVAKRGIWDFTNSGSGQTIVESELIEEIGQILSDTTAIEAAGGALTTAQDSKLTKVTSDVVIIGSDLVIVASDTAAIEAAGGALTTAQDSKLTQVHSDVIVVDAAVSDVESSLVIVKSDLVVVSSDTAAIEAAGGSLTTAQDSKLTKVTSDVVIIGSDLVIVVSDTTAIEAAGGSLTTAQDSKLTQASSDLKVLNPTTAVQTASDVVSYMDANSTVLSDIESSLVIVKSDLVISNSQTTVIESNTAAAELALSDIESSLVIVKSDLVISNSQTTVIESNTQAAESALSDVESSLVIVKSDLVVAASDAAAIESELILVHSETTAIKVKTDDMTYTKANELDVNTKSINDAEVVGDGNATPWDGA